MKLFSFGCAAVLGAALLTMASEASAQDDALRPSTNPWVAELDLGPSIFLTACGSGGCGGFSVTQFKLTQIIGGHPGGDGEGFGIGLGISEAFGSGLFRFQPGLRLWGDIPVADDLAVYISPFGHLGYGLWTVSFGGGGSEAHFFNWAAGVGVKLVLADRAVISFAPVGLDFHANDDGMAMFYDLMFGFGVTF